MPQPSLPVLLKRLAVSNAALAEQIANPRLINDIRRAKLHEEAKGIVADLQAFTDAYVVNVVARTKVGK